MENHVTREEAQLFLINYFKDLESNIDIYCQTRINELNKKFFLEKNDQKKEKLKEFIDLINQRYIDVFIASLHKIENTSM